MNKPFVKDKSNLIKRIINAQKEINKLSKAKSKSSFFELEGKTMEVLNKKLNRLIPILQGYHSIQFN